MRCKSMALGLLLCAVAFTLLISPKRVLAHCDGMDGPVVKAAQKALATGNVDLVLIWVQKQDEAEVIKAFQKTLAVRKLNAAAKELADLYFFETLVRLHRAGEGESYTGLKPAGRDLGPAIPAADKALETGSVEPLLKLVIENAREGIREHFSRAFAKQKFGQGDTTAGREYVKAYVEFVHYAEGLYEASQRAVAGHQRE